MHQYFTDWKTYIVVQNLQRNVETCAFDVCWNERSIKLQQVGVDCMNKINSSVLSELKWLRLGSASYSSNKFWKYVTAAKTKFTKFI